MKLSTIKSRATIFAIINDIYNAKLKNKHRIYVMQYCMSVTLN